jgi:hypothetical protein
VFKNSAEPEERKMTIRRVEPNPFIEPPPPPPKERMFISIADFFNALTSLVKEAEQQLKSKKEVSH